MKVPVYNLDKKEVDKIEVNDRVFGVPFNQAVVHQAIVRQRANARQGTASTKTRSEVSGSTRKLFRQKGTGNARAGSIKSPLRRGGGITFGPKPRSYRQDMPKKMRQLALRCALSEKLRDEELMVLENMELGEIKTKEVARILNALEVNSSALIVTSGVNENVVKSARNLPRVKTTPANLLNVLDVLSHQNVLMTVAAVRNAEEIWGGGNDAPLRGVEAPVNN